MPSYTAASKVKNPVSAALRVARSLEVEDGVEYEVEESLLGMSCVSHGIPLSAVKNERLRLLLLKLTLQKSAAR
ncbi:unnamed protein product [Taenia asiatica]|uniref:GST N-terminal domain-containing protein n=1 Tax=Taenia asiatica TaxID=60517 RepID=A0A0R3WEH7_TAEAS|nr:unnamed protein product [Taenia asiatica]